PFVLYDSIADRWVVSDFAFPSFPGTSFFQCIAVSQTSDPVSGGWFLYALQVDPANPTFLGDYPKFGLWPDACYLAINLVSRPTVPCRFCRSGKFDFRRWRQPCSKR